MNIFYILYLFLFIYFASTLKLSSRLSKAVHRNRDSRAYEDEALGAEGNELKQNNPKAGLRHHDEYDDEDYGDEDEDILEGDDDYGAEGDDEDDNQLDNESFLEVSDSYWYE